MVPVVLHHGEGGWSAARRLEDLFDGRLVTEAGLRDFIPRLSFVLDDLSALSDQVLEARQLPLEPLLALWNDPINVTDPSGFSSQGVNEGISGTTSVLYLPTAVSIAALAKGAGVTAGAIGASLAGGALNVGVSAVMNPFGGSKGGSYQVPSGSAAATSSGGGANAPVAVAQIPAGADDDAAAAFGG